MQLWVGLGNPGAAYALHRHNVGFMAIDAIAEVHGFEPPRKRFHRAAGGGTAYEILDDRDLPLDGMVPLPAARGTCIVLHGLLPHYSAANRSPRSRQAYSLHVIDARATYRPDNWLQRGAAMPLRGFELA